MKNVKVVGLDNNQFKMVQKFKKRFESILTKIASENGLIIKRITFEQCRLSKIKVVLFDNKIGETAVCYFRFSREAGEFYVNTTQIRDFRNYSNKIFYKFIINVLTDGDKFMKLGWSYSNFVRKYL